MKYCNIAALQQIIHDAGKDGSGIIYVSLEHHPDDIRNRVHDYIDEMITVLPSDPLKGISCFDHETRVVGTLPMPELPIFAFKSYGIADAIEDLGEIKSAPRKQKHWEHLRKSRW